MSGKPNVPGAVKQLGHALIIAEDLRDNGSKADDRRSGRRLVAYVKAAAMALGFTPEIPEPVVYTYKGSSWRRDVDGSWSQRPKGSLNWFPMNKIYVPAEVLKADRP